MLSHIPKVRKAAARWRGFSCEERMPVLQSLSAANLFAGLLFSSIGFVGLAYGKRMSLWKPMFIGIALMAYPYFIESTLMICVVGILGTSALFFLRD